MLGHHAKLGGHVTQGHLRVNLVALAHAALTGGVLCSVREQFHPSLQLDEQARSRDHESSD
jgi:hypothetical protein